jgi:hypothetical protein
MRMFENEEHVWTKERENNMRMQELHNLCTSQIVISVMKSTTIWWVGHVAYVKVKGKSKVVTVLN